MEVNPYTGQSIDEDMPTNAAGRGAVAGSLIAYVIGLTEVNPLDWGLIFERFLDLGRDKASFPKMI